MRGLNLPLRQQHGELLEVLVGQVRFAEHHAQLVPWAEPHTVDE